MKRVGVFLLILLVLIAVPVIAQSNSSNSSKTTNSSTNTNNQLTGVQKAYQCLEDLVEEKDSNDFSLQEAIFATLALGAENKLEDKIDDEEGNDCWPESSCTLRDTAQVLLAYDRINKNTEDIEDYLLDRNGTATDLAWFLQIDVVNHEASSCTIKQGSSTATVQIGGDLKISGNPGSCLTIIDTGYWLRIKSSCLDREFEISCEEDFVTSLLYQKEGSDTLFISPNTHSAASSGTTIEKISAQCFKNSGSCDYEGTLWATLALEELGHDTTSFVPYLLAYAEENKRFFPSTFLYIITNGEDQYSEIVDNQINGDYFQVTSTRYNKFYDTALAILALEGVSSSEVQGAKDYLLNSQTPQGCWNNNNIRDTAFILYSAWPNSVRSSGGGSSTGSVSCESSGFSCETVISCNSAGGQILSNYECSSFGKKCCSVTPELSTCNQIGGIVCSSDQKCSSQSKPSIDGSCCIGACIDSPTGNQCETAGGTCDSSCTESETQSSLSCGSTLGVVCCEPKEDSNSGISIWLILLLVLLIALVVLAIIFRKKLEVWWFKVRKGKGMSSSNTRRPPMPPAPSRPLSMGQSQRPRFAQRSIVRRPESKTDKEMEEVFKKLREIGK